MKPENKNKPAIYRDIDTSARLTKRESEVAKWIAWGATKKEVADALNLSVDTIGNHARNIYEKIGCGTVNGLSAWWFCKTYHISFDLSPLKRRIASTSMVALLLFAEYSFETSFMRFAQKQTITLASAYRLRRRNDDYNFLTA